MVASSIKSLIGLGLYTSREAAAYARVNTATINRWIHGTTRSESVVEAQLEGEFDRTITFLDLVQTLAIRSIRHQYHIPLQTIRKAVERSKSHFNIQFPLATKHITWVIADTKELFIAPHGKLSDDNTFYHLTGKHRDQAIIKRVYHPDLENISFDSSEGNLACLYTPIEDKAGRKVILDPTYQLGQPVVESCDYRVQTLFDAYVSEGGIDQAAEAYGVEPGDVQIAVKFYDTFPDPESGRS
jgi:uncharacterized protein (DUF433 family)